MSIKIRFVGGPADGRTLSIPNDDPPPLWLIPQVLSISELLASSLEPTVPQHAEYAPLRGEDGWPRRTDTGTYLYGHRPAPVTAEAREAVERERRKAEVAEARRDAEADAGWQEIRKERPNYPADWRDLF